MRTSMQQRRMRLFALLLLVALSCGDMAWVLAGGAYPPLRVSSLPARAVTNYDDLFDVTDSASQNLISTRESAGAALSKAGDATNGAMGKAEVLAPSVSDPLEAYAEQLVSLLKEKLPAVEPALSQAEPKQLLLFLAVVVLAGLTAVISSLSSPAEATRSKDAAAARVDTAAVQLNETMAAEASGAATAATNVSQSSVVEPLEVNTFVEPTDANAVTVGALLIAFAGNFVGGWVLAGVGYVAACWSGKMGSLGNVDVATAVKGVGKYSIQAINFGSYLNGKYDPLGRLGGSVSSMVSEVQGKDDKVDLVIGVAGQVMGSVAGAAQIFDREIGFKNSAGTLASTATDFGFLVGDAVVEGILPLVKEGLGSATQQRRL